MPDKTLSLADIIYRLLLLAGAMAGAGWLLGRFGTYHWTLDLWAHFAWQYAAIFAVCSLLFALLRKPLAASAALLGLLLCAVWIWPQADRSSLRADSIKLLSANLWAGNRDLAALLALVQREQPEVLILIELSEDQLHQLAKINNHYAHRLLLPGGAFGIGIWSNLPDSALHYEFLGGAHYPALTLSAEIDEQALRLIAAHPFPPIGARNQPLRQRQQRDLLRLIAADPANTVLVGDLNATPWSQSYLDWQALGLSGGAHWPTPTWAPTGGLGWALAIPIDHALAGAHWSIVERRVAGSIGSDHRPLIVRIAPMQR